MDSLRLQLLDADPTDALGQVKQLLETQDAEGALPDLLKLVHCERSTRPSYSLLDNDLV